MASGLQAAGGEVAHENRDGVDDENQDVGTGGTGDWN